MIPKSLICTLAVAALAMLVACAAPEIRPEPAVITSPIDEVWVAFIEVAKDWRFQLETLDSSKRVIKGAMDTTTVIGGRPDPTQRFAGSTRKQHHDLRVSMRPQGEQSTAIEIAYAIDKVADEETGFALVNAVREWLAKGGR